jgi:hypothetical protein
VKSRPREEQKSYFHGSLRLAPNCRIEPAEQMSHLAAAQTSQPACAGIFSETALNGHQDVSDLSRGVASNMKTELK